MDVIKKYFVKTCTKLGVVALLFVARISVAQNIYTTINEVVSTTDKSGNAVCFRIVAVCGQVQGDCCGPRCMIDGSIYPADCITKRVYDTLVYTTYHVEYINGNWQWAHVCIANTCVLCSCQNVAGTWAIQHNLNGLQDLVDLAQYLNSCCAPAVPNPIDCDSTVLDVSVFCTRVIRWCCNGKLMRLKFTLYPCNSQGEEILTDSFSLHYHSGNVNEHSSYDIFSDSDNPCSLSEEKRRLILQAFLESQGSDPCDDTRAKSSKNQPKE